MPAAMTTSTGLFICNSSCICRGFRHCIVLRLLYTASPPVARHRRGGEDQKCAPRALCAYSAEKFFFNSAMPERLRTLRHCIFTGRILEPFPTKNSPGGLPEEHSFFYSKHGCAALTWCAAGLTSGTLPRRGRRCRPECRTPEIRLRPARQPAALRT